VVCSCALFLVSKTNGDVECGARNMEERDMHSHALTFVSLSCLFYHRVSVFRQKYTGKSYLPSFLLVAAQTLMDVDSEVWKLVE
jgi:hypothetical protein